MFLNFPNSMSNSREIAMEKKNQIHYLLALPDNINLFLELYDLIIFIMHWGNIYSGVMQEPLGPWHRQENRRLVGHFYDMKNRFWAVGCGLGCAVLKKVWADYFCGQKKKKIFWKHCSVRTEKLHRKKVKKNYFFLWEEIFFSENPVFFRAKNATVST